jgi:hypothetical protein
VERKPSWQDKITILADRLNFQLDRGIQPFQTLQCIFKFRDRLAHGKTETEEKTYLYSSRADDERNTDPDSLSTYWSNDAVQSVLNNVAQFITLLHKAAGYPDRSVHTIGHGSFEEQQQE